MPWKASSVMEERLFFVARLLDGEAMTEVCREFGISRKTGYKILDRYKEHGLAVRIDRSRRHHNTVRPHASLGYKPPAPDVLVPAFTAWPAPLNRSAPPATLAQSHAPN